MPSIIDNIVKEIKTREVLFGAKVTLKRLKKDKETIEKIYLSEDCPIKTITEIRAIFPETIDTGMTKEELREICKKPFNISVISVLKARDKEEETKRERDNKEDRKRKEKQGKEKSEKGEKK